MTYRVRNGIQPFDLLRAKKLYYSGLALDLVAAELNVPYGTLYYWFKKLKVKSRPRTRGQSERLKIRNKKIREMRKNGDKILYIASVFNLTQQYISRICKGVLPPYTHYTTVNR